MLRDPVQVIRLFKQLCPDRAAHLVERTTVTREPGVAGRNHKPGSWALLFLAHVLTGSPDWAPFWAQNQSSSELWLACGFEAGHVPSWATLQERFDWSTHASSRRSPRPPSTGSSGCKYCGGPTVADDCVAPFAIQAGDPRLRVRCLLRHTDRCKTAMQTMSCSKHWRLLLPLSRMDARYYDLLRAHKTGRGRLRQLA